MISTPVRIANNHEMMDELKDVLSFFEVATQRTGYITDGPFPFADDNTYSVRWDDTGKLGTVIFGDIRIIRVSERHITDGIRRCHCGPIEIDGVVTHRATYELN